MKRNQRILLILATLPFLAAPSQVAAESLAKKLVTRLGEFQARHEFPGATVAVAFSHGEVITTATGHADLETGTPMTAKSRMLAASIGKTFVAATVHALDADGLLDIDAPVSRYLGNRKWFPRLPNHKTMTVAHLLRHASGLPDHVHVDAFAREMKKRVTTGDDALPAADAIAFVLDAEPLFPAGKAWSYTDTGYLLLGMIIEQVTERPYYEEIDQRFINPLALSDTAPSNHRNLADLAVGYTSTGNPFGIPQRTMDEDGRLYWDPAVEWTGGGLVSTSRDLAVWGRALFTGSAMEEPYLDALLDGMPVAPDTPNRRYGTGVAIHANTPRGTVYGHAGWIPGYVSSLRHYVDHGITVAFQINTDVGIVDDTSDVVPTLENALVDLVIEFGSAASQP